MEANIAAELFIPNGSDIGASNAVKGLSGEHPLNYFVDVQGLDNIKYQRSDVENTYLVFGPNIALTEKTSNSTTLVGSGASTGTGRVTTDKTVNIADSTFQIDFDQAFAGLSSYASAQYARPDTGVSVEKSYGEGVDQNNWAITVSCDDGDDVVNLTKWELENCKLNVVASQTGAYSLVVNVSDAADGDIVTFGEGKGMSIDGTDYDSYGAIAGKVLFNFGTSAGTYTFKKYQMGVALAPNGTVVCDSYSHNGCMYANTVKNLNCELHQRSFTPRSVVPPTPREGSLKIVKMTAGGTTPADTEFTVTGPDGYSKTVRYSEFENGSLEIDGLVPGEYSVKESNADVEGYSLQVTGDDQSVAVAAGKAAEAKLTNSYSQKPGSLKIVKATEGGTTPADATFTVTGPNGYSKTVRYSEFSDGAYELDGIAPGEYTVKESNADVEGYSLQVVGDGQAIVVAAGKAAEAKIVNEYSQKPGSLKIIKTTEGGQTPADATFTVTGPNGFSKMIKFSEFENGSFELDGLVPGEYTVKESNADVEGYALQVVGDDQSVAVAAGRAAEAKIVNEYTQQPGSLKIVKATEGGQTPADATFTVTGPNGFSKEVRYSEFSGGCLEIGNLAPGEYTVKESNADVEGYALQVTGDDQSVAVAAGKAAEAKLTNSYSQKPGSLKIVKATEGGTTPADAEFTVTGPDGFSKTVRYSEFENGSYELDGLVPGEYTVKESNADVEGYSLQVTGDGQAIAVAAGATAEAHLTNTYTPPAPPKEQTPPSDTPKNQTPSHKSPSPSPKTGDLAPLSAVAGLVLLAGAGAAFAARKRHMR